MPKYGTHIVLKLHDDNKKEEKFLRNEVHRLAKLAWLPRRTRLVAHQSPFLLIYRFPCPLAQRLLLLEGPFHPRRDIIANKGYRDWGVNLNLGEIQTRKQEDGLLMKFLKTIAVLNPHLIKIGLGHLELHYSLLPNLVHMLMKGSQLGLEVRIPLR